MIKSLAAFVFLLVFTVSAAAQDTFWVQIEARQTLTGAQERARDYARRLDDVAGFYLGDNFYGIFIGPFGAPQAEVALADLLGRDAVPPDSFVKNGQFFKQQFWPIGGNAQSANTPPRNPVSTPPQADPTPPVDPTPAADETPAQARAFERTLTREAREELQRALKWAGHYDAAIDGSFGRGTRAAMQSWQVANDLEGTGILTSAQRDILLGDYNSVLDGMNLRLVRDDASGIQMLIPTDVVAFTEYKPPFVQFEASGDIPATVLFISQAGDGDKLIGLYEVFQILDIVPPDGPRRRTDDGFVIEGIGNGIHSYTTVSLQDGAIKGFSLIWPEGDEQRRSRVLEKMEPSFQRIDGVLDPRIVPASEDQTIDMVAGLAVRQPQLARSGIYVSATGAVVTTPQAITGCERITIDRDYAAEVVFSDDALGLALVRPTDDLVPLGVASFNTGTPRLQDRIAVAGYPFNGVLPAPTLTYGQIIDIRNLTGDDRFKRLSILPQNGDAGGPVFDETGAVLGMLLPRADDSTRVLPPEVNFSIDAAEIVALLDDQEITALTSGATDNPVSPVELTRQAADVTALVSCW